jgi:hypothetical protein
MAEPQRREVLSLDVVGDGPIVHRLQELANVLSVDAPLIGPIDATGARTQVVRGDVLVVP